MDDNRFDQENTTAAGNEGNTSIVRADWEAPVLVVEKIQVSTRGAYNVGGSDGTFFS